MKLVKHLGGSTWEAVIKAKWWPNQRQAIDLVASYLESGTGEQAMVRMPTATGKTLVIATLARLLEDYPTVLVVAPWENLVEQLAREVSERVWVKLAEANSLSPKPTTVFTPASLRDALKKSAKAGVLVCTNQTLQALRKDDAEFKRLRKWVSLALVDEGHREPAPKWAEAVRDLDCHTVLFTATPYRNDLQFFHVNRDFFYCYTYGEAQQDRLVRDVEFIDGAWARDTALKVEEFVSALLKACKAAEKEVALSSGEMRVIVRCNDAAEIKAVVTALQSRGESAIGLHERFKAADGSAFRRNVPDPANESARFWVHQNKLIEGLDDPAFRLIAVFSAFSNARNLVQQVGRVIRNPDRAANQKAFVLAHREEKQKELWNRFLDYERDVLKRTNAGRPELAAFDDFVASHDTAPSFYLLGDFRRRLRAEDTSDPRSVIQMRKSVMVRVAKSGFNWKKLVLGIRTDLLTGDAVSFGGDFQDKETFLQLFQIFEQTDVVSDAYMETRLGYAFARQIGGTVFFFDSEGRTPEYLRKATSPIAPEILQRLLPDEKTTIKEVSLINGDFGNHAFRRRVVSTQSLQAVPPALSDYVQVCSTATGSVRQPVSGRDETRRRYVSFTRGRLSERTTPIMSYQDFSAWLATINKELEDTQRAGEDSLLRFARPSRYDATESARHILFDITSEELDSSALKSANTTTDPENYWLIKNGSFFGEIDEKPFEAQVAFNPDTERFEIESDELDKVIAKDSGKPLTKYLNETQDFRILLGASTVYTQGRFFTPNLLPWKGGGNRLNIQRIVAGCDGLRDIESEKGDLTGWSADSVFGAIVDKTKVFAAATWTPEILVCGDVASPEIADFFGLCETTKRIVMIHGKKARKGSIISASAFHDVCSQAVRYLGFFNVTDKATKLTTIKVGADWSPDASKYKKRKRLVWAKGNPTPSEVAKKFMAAIEDPTFTREVWLVMGNGLSQSAFEQGVLKAKPKPNEREMSYLFQSTWCAVASVGASLKVICMP